MARWVGDTWTITCTVTDPVGTPVDATSVTATVLLPDGTTSGPTAMTHTGTGVYTLAYVSTLAGMHSATFTATGAIAPVGMTDFYVYPLAQGLVSLEEVRSHLRITPEKLATYSTRLLSWIQASRVLIEDIVGALTVTTHDEWYDGGHPSIMLLESPVASITAVTETFGANVVRTLTLQQIDGILPVNAYGYTVDYDTGLLIRRVTGIAAPFALGRRNVRVQYSSGQPGAWRENVRLANLETLRVWWLASQDGNDPQPLSGGAYDEAVPALVGELPARARQMLGRRTRVTGIG